MKGRKTTKMRFIEEIVEGKGKSGGVVLEEKFQERRGKRGVEDDGILNGENGNVWRRKEDLRGDFKKSGKEVESRSSKSFRGIQ